MACLAGVGFKMSLFVGGLSLADALIMNQVRMGVLAGSIVPGILAYIALMPARRSPIEEMPQTVAAQ